MADPTGQVRGPGPPAPLALALPESCHVPLFLKDGSWLRPELAYFSSVLTGGALPGGRPGTADTERPLKGERVWEAQWNWL